MASERNWPFSTSRIIRSRISPKPRLFTWRRMRYKLSTSVMPEKIIMLKYLAKKIFSEIGIFKKKRLKTSLIDSQILFINHSHDFLNGGNPLEHFLETVFKHRCHTFVNRDFFDFRSNHMSDYSLPDCLTYFQNLINSESALIAAHIAGLATFTEIKSVV